MRARSRAPAGDREDAEHVVAVHPHAREAEALGALVDRHTGLLLGRLGDGPLVVLAEEHDRGVVDRGEREGLGHVALAGGAVAEVRDHRAVGAVLGDAHGVAGGVQRLGADDDRVQLEVVAVGVPAAVVHTAEHPEQVGRVDSAAPGHAVLTVGREDVVVLAGGPAGPDLGGLLAEQRRPQAQLALALQGGGLGVEAAGEHHVAVEAAELFRRDAGDVLVVLGVLDALALGRQQLHELGLGAGVLLGGRAGALGAGGAGLASGAASRCARGSALHGHVCSSVGPAPGVAGRPVRLTCSRPTGHGVGATRPGTGVTGAPASALQKARYPVRHISVKPPLTCDFAWISK